MGQQDDGGCMVIALAKATPTWRSPGSRVGSSGVTQNRGGAGSLESLLRSDQGRVRGQGPGGPRAVPSGYGQDGVWDGAGAVPRVVPYGE